MAVRLQITRERGLTNWVVIPHLWLTLLALSCFDAMSAHAQDAVEIGDDFSIERQGIPQPKTRRRPRLQWTFKRLHWAEGLTAGVLIVPAIVLLQSDVPRNWTGNNAFDNWFRERLLASDEKREKYARASDALALTAIGFPILVDMIGVAFIGDRNEDVGLQMLGIQAQAFAISGFLTNVFKLTGRERPWALDAGCSDPSVSCSSNANESFFSGHTSMAFTGAGLTCVEHQHLPLFGSGHVGGPIACASTLTMATLTGIFRIVSNQHWTTDVIAGAGVGLVSGWLMPWLMHYRHDLTKRDHKKRQLSYLAPYGGPGVFGLSAAGNF